MNAFRRVLLFDSLLAVPVLLSLAGRAPVSCSEPARDAAAPVTAAHQFYTRALGEWVGTLVSRLDDAEPATSFFHPAITRLDQNTFREEYIFYRIQPKTEELERSGTQSVLSTIGGGGTIEQTSRGSGTVLIDFKAKNQSFEDRGEARSTDPTQLETKATGKIAVDGLPLNLGKNGKLRKVTATLALEGDRLVGRTRVEISFRVLFLSKRCRIDTDLRAQRGGDVQRVATGLSRGPGG